MTNPLDEAIHAQMAFARAFLHHWSCMEIESRSHETSVRLEAVHPWCGRLTPHLLRPRGLASLDHLGDGLAHRQPLIAAKVASRGKHPAKREEHATNRIHSYAAQDTMIQSAIKHNFYVLSLCSDSIKYPTCFQGATCSRVR